MRLRHPTLLAALCAILGCGVFPAPAARAADDNSLAVTSGDSVTLETQNNIDLSKEGAVEFWYAHTTSQADRNAQTNDTALNDAYSVVLSFGTGKEMASAVIIGPGGTRDDHPNASIGVVKDLSVLTDPVLVPKAVRNLKKTDEFGGAAFAPTKLYHIMLVQPPAPRNVIMVYVDGVWQGEIPGNFGQTRGLPLVIGGHAPKLDAGKPAAGEPPVFPFNGTIAGLRVWRTGAFDGSQVSRLMDFQRPTDLVDLAALSDYGYLTAYGDFNGERPRLRTADPLAGAWIAANATVTQTATESSTFDDYPVYSFEPATPVAVPADPARRVYNVYEDGNYIGTLRWAGTPPSAADASEAWTFQHADSGWKPIAVRHFVNVTNRPRDSFRDWRLSFALAGSVATKPTGEPLPFAGSRAASVDLKRRTTAELNITSLSGPVTRAEREAKAQKADAISEAFLLDKFPKFYDVLYSSFNAPTMDPWKLMAGGKGSHVILRKPEKDQFILSNSDQMIWPFDLQPFQEKMGYEALSSRIVSNASEYNSAVTSRVGGGFNLTTSGTVGIGIVSVSMAYTNTIVVQGETALTVAGEDLDRDERVFRNKWTKSHALVHKKELIRFTPEFAKTLRRLLDDASRAPTPEDRRSVVNQFFNEYGTHYPLGIVFGTQEFSETVINEQMRKVALNRSRQFDVDVNGGKNGETVVRSDNKAETSRLETTTRREFGNDANQVPIAMDLRPIHELLTPQQFPGEPRLYTELRYLLASSLDPYMVSQAISYRSPKVPPEKPQVSAAQMKKAVDDMRTPPPPPKNYEVLALRYAGVTMTPWKMPPIKLPDGKQIEMPSPLGEVMDHPVDGEIVFSADAVSTPSLGAPPEVANDVSAFSRPRKELTVVTVARANEVKRTLRAGRVAQWMPVGEDPVFSVRVPVADRDRGPQLSDYVFCGIRGRFFAPPGTQPQYEISGSSPTPGDWLPYEVVRSLHPTVKLYTLNLPFDAVVPTAPADAGTVLWANRTPAPIVVKREIELERLPTVPKGASGAVLKKDRVAADNEPYVFKAPDRFNNSRWRTGFVTVPVEVRQRGNVVANSSILIGYEYALLPDVKGAKDSYFPEASWGKAKTGPVTNAVDPLANRSTRTLRPAPSAAVHPSALETLGLPSDRPFDSHSIVSQGYALRSAGLGLVAFEKGDAPRCWMFLERAPGEWMILNTVDSLALTVTDRGVVGTPPRDGDPSQLWLVVVIDPVAGTYAIKSKLKSKYLAPAGGDVPTAPLLNDERTAAGDVKVSPAVDLSPGAQFGRSTDAPGDAEQAKLLSELAATLALPFTNIAVPDVAAAADLATTDYFVAYDLNRDGKVDEAEYPMAEGPFPVTPEAFRARLVPQIDAGVTKARTRPDPEAAVAAKLESWVGSYRDNRNESLVRRLIRLLDKDADRLLDATEGKPVFDLLSANGTPIAVIDTNRDGKADEAEFIAAVATASTRLPKP